MLSARAQSDSADDNAPSSSSRLGSSATTATGSFETTRALTGDLVALTQITGSDITYASPTVQITVNPQTTTTANETSIDESTSSFVSGSDFSATRVTRTSKENSLTVIGGSPISTASSTSAETASSTASSTAPVNTIPCNGYPEFCNRQYSNITEVCAHNSAFDVENNAASNQELGIIQQLNDGVRMIQGETRLENGTIYMCHSSCDLLNAGPWQTELETIVRWLEANPYDVVTVLIVNSMYLGVGNYTSAIENSGIREYLYEPEYIPQHRDQWPTLGEMIISGKRVVMFMDYQANQQKVPYILNEFTHMWETPFSPTNESFPCTQQRPPNLPEEAARERYMYLANHNLNTAISLSSFGLGGADTGGDTGAILIPTTSELNNTNAQGYDRGMLGAMNRDCTEMWDRPPNFLLVDYYNVGEPEAGSVFEVAARANGVEYNGRCCGQTSVAASVVKGQFVGKSGIGALAAAVMSAVVLSW
ncbi:hypothetical protein MBLNU230_g5673t1 [Neophaeotheca triangularis]